MPVPARPSRNVLMTGMAAPTAASKFSAAPCFSAAFASLIPCFASNALLAVTTDLPAFSAASTADSAGSPTPPISSTKQSTSGWVASAIGSLAHSTPRRSTPRFFAFERAVTATTRMPRPLRPASTRLCVSIKRTTSAPTVPSPAMPTLRGATMMLQKTCRRELAPAGERKDVVQRFDAAFKEAAHAARGLPDPLLVFHHGDADISFAMLTEADPGRDHDAGFLHHQGCELHAADAAERFQQRRPGKHRGLRRRNLPTGTAERFHQSVAALAVGVAHLLYAIVRAVERSGRGDLDRREGAVIEVGFHTPECGNYALVADRKAHAPARHGIGLRHRGEFDGDIDRAGHLEHRGRRVTLVEIDLGIGEIGQDQDLVFLRERDEILVEIEAREMGGGVGGIADDKPQRLGDRMSDPPPHRLEKLRRRLRRHRADHTARHQKAEGVNWIARVRTENDVAGRGDRLGHVGKALLGAERRHHLGIRIEFDPKAALV